MWSARLWYWRQVTKTVPHLFYAQLVLEPWQIFTAVVAGLVLLALTYLPFYAVQPFLTKYYPPPYLAYWPEPLRLAWITLWDWVYTYVELILPSILVGWIVARASQGRDMVVTIVLGCVSLSLGMIVLFILFSYYPHVAPKPRSVWSFFWLTRPHEAIVAPIGTFIGALIARKMARVFARPAR